MSAIRLRWVAMVAALAVTTGCASTASVLSDPSPPAVDTNAGRDVRGVRYCEVLPVFWRGGTPTAEVYNTLGLNDCPAEDWEALDADELKEQTGALSVVLNGPRAWDMDEIRDDSGKPAQAPVRFGNLHMIERAEVRLGIGGLLRGELDPFVDTQKIKRTTSFTYRAGRPIRVLTDPDGQVFVMQSHDLTTVPNQAALEAFEPDLPQGWSYRVVTPDADVVVSADGYAEVLRDDQGGTYQRVDAGVERLLTPRLAE